MILLEYINENREQFAEKVKDIAYNLGINENWLMAVMFKESTLNHKAVNSYTGATGLIQFMPQTAAGLGTTTEALKNMSNVEQLEYVYRYFKPYKYRIKTYVDAYLTVFFPRAVGKEPGYILRTETLPAELIASQNLAMDTNRDFAITKQEVEAFALKNFPQEIIDILLKKKA